MGYPTDSEVMEQVRRIVSSSGFVGSDPARKILLFLAEYNKLHPGESVKELTLAMEALGRGSDYDPHTDSSVRVIASRLRAKLAEYYTNEGSCDPVLVSIPKGAYSILTSYRPVELHSGLTDPGLRLRSRRQLVTLCIAGVIGAGAGFPLGYMVALRSGQRRIPEVSKLFWGHFVSGDPPIIVFSNPRFVGVPSTGLRVFNPSAPPDGPINALYTGIGEVTAVYEISRQLSALGREAHVKRAQLFTWDDARSSDLIFIGGQEQNLPMSQLPPLEKFNLLSDSKEPFAPRGAVRTERPGPGEQSYYLATGDDDNGVDYGILALTPGVTASRRVLVLAGIHTFATEGAASFVVSPALLTELWRKLDISTGGDFPMFEAVIEVRVRGGYPLPPKLLTAWRRNAPKN